MSLCVYLTKRKEGIPDSSLLFVRLSDDRYHREFTLEEWNDEHPGGPHLQVVPGTDEGEEVFRQSITNDLQAMAAKAGLLHSLWWPEKRSKKKASDLIDHLREGLKYLIDNPISCRKFAPSPGTISHGPNDYEALVAFVARYYAACLDHPDADVRVLRS
jgi:hypothetical protein